MWVQSRQHTGRIVTVANSKIFDEPVYNYTRNFPFSGRRCRFQSPTTMTTSPLTKSLAKAKIGVASSTYDIVGLPTIRVQLEGRKSENARS